MRNILRCLLARKPKESSPEIAEATKTVYAAVEEARETIRRLADADAKYIGGRHQPRG